MLAYLVVPLVPVGLAVVLAGRALPPLVEYGLTLALILPTGPLLYRIAFRPIADAPVLVLLIVAVVLHFAVSGLACGVRAEGARPRLLADGGVDFAGLYFPAQMLLMLGASAGLALGLWVFFERSMTGKAVRATAINRVGARLVGIRPGQAGTICVSAGLGTGGGGGDFDRAGDDVVL